MCETAYERAAPLVYRRSRTGLVYIIFKFAENIVRRKRSAQGVLLTRSQATTIRTKVQRTPTDLNRLFNITSSIAGPASWEPTTMKNEKISRQIDIQLLKVHGIDLPNAQNTKHIFAFTNTSPHIYREKLCEADHPLIHARS